MAGPLIDVAAVTDLELGWPVGNISGEFYSDSESKDCIVLRSFCA